MSNDSTTQGVRRRRRLLAVASVEGVVFVASIGVAFAITYRNALKYDIPTAEARAFFGFMLAYLPLALIGVFVQGLDSDRAKLNEALEVFRLLDQATRERSASSQVIDALGAEILNDLQERPEMASSHEFLEMVNRRASLEKKLGDLASAVAPLQERVDHERKWLRTEGRLLTFTVLLGTSTIVFALFGMLLPEQLLLIAVLAGAISLTRQLVEVVLKPWLETLGDAERLVMVIPWGFAVGAAAAICAQASII